ncbi:hypothetical protein A6E25_22890 [Bacillus cereus]|nr:hypothetical protein A6E25_22890 [Bacillus cereus]
MKLKRQKRYKINVSAFHFLLIDTKRLTINKKIALFNVEQNTGKMVSHSCVEHDRLTVFICLNHFRKTGFISSLTGSKPVNLKFSKSKEVRWGINGSLKLD